MSKLDAQLALFGVIDEIVTRTADPRIAATVERFLPGTTGPGQRGWYRELTRFLSQDALAPRDAQGNVTRVGAVRMPSYTQALSIVAGEPVEEFPSGPNEPEGPGSPSVLLNSLFASTIIGQIRKWVPDGLALPGWDITVDPIAQMLPVAVSASNSMPPTSSGDAEPLDLELPTQEILMKLNDVQAYQALIDQPADIRTAQDDPLKGQLPATGVLRRVNGQWCSLLTTDSPHPEIPLSQMRMTINPQNWPKLCTFFIGMEPQPALAPDVSRGWSRVLERVSGDRTQWELRTALKYFRGVGPGDGIFVNYDLDDPRCGDDNLVEVDSGYIWVTPLKPDDPEAGVRVRTSKAVRIRGLSATATAALASICGWGDASGEMLVRKASKLPAGLVDFGNPSYDTGAVSAALLASARDAAAAAAAADAAADAAAAAADATDATYATDRPAVSLLVDRAERLEMLPGWRGALIGNMHKEVSSFIDSVAQPLASDLACKWSDGMTAEDIEGFGTKAGTALTGFAVAAFGAAAAALRSPADDE